MTSPKNKPKSDQALLDELDLDVLLDDMPIEEVDAELKAAGVDADRIDRWGRAVARERLNARLDGPAREQPWKIKARERLARARELDLKLDRSSLPRDRAGLLTVVHRLRTELGPRAEVVFRKREPEAADETELLSLIEELMLLEALSDDDDDGQDGDA